MKTPALLILLISCASCRSQQEGLVNFGHLNHLTEEIQFEGFDVSIVHIYSNYPDYKWVGAEESGPEGIACVDDAARAAVLYLRHYELTGAEESRLKAESLLRFVLAMEADDGNFYNFIFNDHSINRTGRTSFQSFGWWAARGVWSIGLGYRVLSRADPEFASRLKQGFALALPHVDSLLQNYGRVKTVAGYKIPEWLPYGSGADVTSELLLGLTEFYSANPDSSLKRRIKLLADGLMTMQDGGATVFPYGVHRSWETLWHMWGNSQTEALAFAGKILGDSAMIRSGVREARWFYSRLLIEGFFKEMDVTAPTRNTRYEQIAYGIRPMAVGLIRLFEATGDTAYLTLAGLAASWLFGNNVLGKELYSPETGRGLDGIRDSVQINMNSGAESTIEALMTVLEAERYPAARRCMFLRKISSAVRGDILYSIFAGPSGQHLALVVDTGKPELRLLEGEECMRFESGVRR